MDDSELPSYNAVSEQPQGPRKPEHLYALEKKDRKWLILHVKSHANTPESLPVFFEGDAISGHVELDLDRPETVKGITIAIKGGTTFVGQEEFRFLDMRHTLWDPNTANTNSKKLSGKHSWSFRFELPREVFVREAKGKEERAYPLPPYFSERASPAYVDYKLVVTVKRGALSVDQTLSTIITYNPITFPGPPSSLRRLSYEKGTPLPGPDVDTEGWKIYPSRTVKGILFDAKQIEVESTLAIATPLSYAVGSPIHFVLTLESEDNQALDIFSSPSAIRLQLVRSMATGHDAADENVLRRTDNCFLEGAGIAFFWVTKEEANKRVLHGELELARSLKPTFTFPRFTIRYHLELLPFQAPGFVSEHIQGETLLVADTIVVASRQTPGIKPSSHAPPGYEKPQRVDYNKSVGLLENGNQRFYHHGHW